MASTGGGPRAALCGRDGEGCRGRERAAARAGGPLRKMELDMLGARVAFQDTLSPDPCFLEASVAGAVMGTRGFYSPC